MFVELRAHTAYSFGDGVLPPEALAKRARRLGYTHLAVTDSADLGGLVRFAQAMRKPLRDEACADAATHAELGADACPRCERPLAPIAGAELVVDGHPAAFLARNAQGYRNLAALVTLARVGAWETWQKDRQGDRRGRPQVTWAQVAAHAQGLHALTGPASGMIASRLRARDDLGAREILRQWREVFDASRLSVEVQLHHVSGSEAALAGRLITLAEHEGVPWVVAHDPRYVDADGRLAHDVLTANRHGVTLDEASQQGLLRPNGEWSLISPRSMLLRWSGRTEGIRESRRIAEECEPLDLAWMRPPMPVYPPPSLAGDTAVSTHTTNAMLRLRTYEGAHERWGRTLSPQQEGQLEKELELVARLGFGGFFLVMWDAVRFARSRNILCQGRGSAANSAVAFCLGITAVDPVKHGLLFERFLSEVRADGAAEPPDIDVDFEHERREEVLDYMYDTWGRGHAAITAVTQQYRAPNAVRDTLRAFGYPLEVADALAKRLHYADPAEGAEAIRGELGKAHGFDAESSRGAAALRTIAAFDGVARLRSTHVGGFVLSSAPLGSYLPVEQTSMGRTILQFDKDDLDDLGVPKFDFLGLGGLTM
ncbi:MAG TPA: PHP domain-containing protein, partial [Gemmatimonadaceae bacterium]|nr:PHP domain-containing protein [Gemmatimonadaceae bacterium]